jgi:hypothetical protein
LGAGLGVGDSDMLPPSILLSKYLFVNQILLKCFKQNQQTNLC